MSQPVCYYATPTQVFEVALLQPNRCVVLEHDGMPEMTLNMQWGNSSDEGFVFALGNMPKGKEQIKLPIVVEGGYLTGNRDVANAMHTMLRGVAALAVQASALSFAKGLEIALQRVHDERDMLDKLPTFLGSEPIGKSASGRRPKDDSPIAPAGNPPPQAAAADGDEEDGPDSDSDYIVG